MGKVTLSAVVAVMMVMLLGVEQAEAQYHEKLLRQVNINANGANSGNYQGNPTGNHGSPAKQQGISTANQGNNIQQEINPTVNQGNTVQQPGYQGYPAPQPPIPIGNTGQNGMCGYNTGQVQVFNTPCTFYTQTDMATGRPKYTTTLICSQLRAFRTCTSNNQLSSLYNAIRLVQNCAGARVEA